LGYGNDSVARVLLFRELVSIGLSSFLLKCDIMQRDQRLEDTLTHIGQAVRFHVSEESNFLSII
jgi:hypothetical protein